MKTIKEIIKYKELLLNLVIRNLKIRYKGSMLGFFWTLLDPLLMMMVYLLFIKLMRFSIKLPVLFVGVIAWQFFVMCVSDGVGTISGNTNLVKKVYFPRIILPMAMCLANLVNFILSVLMLLVILMFFGIDVSLLWCLFPLIAVFNFIFCFGVALFVSSFNVFFKDTEHLISVVLMMMFFMSPIIYPITKVPDRFMFLYFLNPMSTMITLYRKIFLGMDFQFVTSMYFSFIVIIVVYFLGYKFFNYFQRYFADEL